LFRIVYKDAHKRHCSS